MEKRPFRYPESYKAEQITRKMVRPFIEARGFAVAADSFDPAKKSQTQSIQATDPAGRSTLIRVKLCWPSRKTGPEKSFGYASQLIAKVKDGDWEGSITRYVEGARRKHITHLALIAREGAEITNAALIPISELVPIWQRQRTTYHTLIKNGKLGRRKSNPAENGSSPTLYIRDDEAPEALEALWTHRGVSDLVRMKVVLGNSSLEVVTDDTFDDLPGLDTSLLGSDGVPRFPIVRSMVKRDQGVRREVLRRANGRCERQDCNILRSFPGFFDVHHILGADVSDRVHNCVALCPNCHREAHFSPDSDAINEGLLTFARRFQGRRHHA
jgi:5-methylcytosine-specific restriction protein A